MSSDASAQKGYRHWVARHVHCLTSCSVAYVGILKSGSTSVKYCLWRTEFYAKRWPDPPDIHRAHDNPDSPFHHVTVEEKTGLLESGFVFTFCRNPFTRALSCYLDKVVAAHERGIVVDQLHDDLQYLENDVTFRDFLEYVASVADPDRNVHLQSQSAFARIAQQDYAFVGSVESFEKDMRFVLGRIRRKEATAHILRLNRRDSAEKLAQYYDAATIDLTRSIYAVDFDTFGYSTRFADALEPPRRSGGSGAI